MRNFIAGAAVTLAIVLALGGAFALGRTSGKDEPQQLSVPLLLQRICQ
jgi:hypothetical protein